MDKLFNLSISALQLQCPLRNFLLQKTILLLDFGSCGRESNICVFKLIGEGTSQIGEHIVERYNNCDCHDLHFRSKVVRPNVYVWN